MRGSSQSAISVVVADDQALMRSGFARILNATEQIKVVAEVEDGMEALMAARSLSPDVVLMDVQMPVMNGIAAARAIIVEGLSRVLVLTTFDREDYLLEAVDVGVSGFLVKTANPDDLIRAVHTVATGGAVLGPSTTARVIDLLHRHRAHSLPELDPRKLRDLTPRERDTVALVAEGLSNAEIADVLGLRETTVKSHVSSSLSKLGLRDRVQLVIFAYDNGIVRPR